MRNAATDINNPELIQLLREVDPRGGMAPFSVEQKRSAYRKAIARSGPPEPVASVTNRTVGAPSGEVPVRIYSPHETEATRLPIVLYLHGGGFISGDLDTHDPVCRMLSNHVPAVVVGVDYPLAPEHPYPAAVEDCFAVLRWLTENADSIGGDARRIAVAGDSAGGNLAAVLPLMARDRGLTPLAAQVLIYPMVDATLSSGSLVENALVPPFTLADCVKAWQLYLDPKQDRRDPYVSPLYAESLTGLPPALILSGEFDILSDEDAAYAGRLEASGVKTEHEQFPGMIHGFFQWYGVAGAARLAMNRVVQFLQRATAERAAPAPP